MNLFSWILNSFFIIMPLTFVILKAVRFANTLDLGPAHTQFVLATLNVLIQGL